MGKQWAKQQANKNEIQDFLERIWFWIQANRQTATIAAGAVALASLLTGLLLYRNHAQRMAAWNRLALAQNSAYGGRPDVSLLQIKELAQEHAASAAAGFGLLFAGDLLYPRGQYKEALEHYSRVVETGQPALLQPLALSDMAMTQEAAGQFQEAAATSQRFLESHPDHFLAPQVHAGLARSLQSLGRGEEAKAALQKISLQYPDTSWAAWAQSRLQGK